MQLALMCGVTPDYWLAHPEQLATAADIVNAERTRRRG